MAGTRNLEMGVYKNFLAPLPSANSLKSNTDGITHHLSPNSYVMTTYNDTFIHPLSMVAGHEASSYVILIMSILHCSDDVVCREVNFCVLLQDNL